MNLMEQHVNLRVPVTVESETTRSKALQAVFLARSGTLSRQIRLRDVSTAEAQYGLAYTWKDLQRHIRHTLPFRFFRRRVVKWFSISEYPGMIPDAALLKFHDASTSGQFDQLGVATVTYGVFDQHKRRAIDPWLIGRLSGLRDGEPSHIVLAYWA